MIRKINLTYQQSIFILLVFALFSCKEDKEEPIETNNLIGVWVVQSGEVNLEINGQDYQTYIQESDSIPEDSKQAYINTIEEQLNQIDLIIPENSTLEFKSDNTFTAKESGQTSGTGTWSLSSDETQLTINSPGEDPATFNIVSLTASSMTLSIEFTDTGDVENDGTDEEFTFIYEINLTKSAVG